MERLQLIILKLQQNFRMVIFYIIPSCQEIAIKYKTVFRREHYEEAIMSFEQICEFIPFNQMTIELLQIWILSIFHRVSLESYDLTSQGFHLYQVTGSYHKLLLCHCLSSVEKEIPKYSKYHYVFNMILINLISWDNVCDKAALIWVILLNSHFFFCSAKQLIIQA